MSLQVTSQIGFGVAASTAVDGAISSQLYIDADTFFAATVTLLTPVTLQFQSNKQSTSDLTTYTFSAVPLGVATADRLVVVAVGGLRSSTNRTISSVKIGGVTAAALIASGNTAPTLAFYSLVVAAGTHADIEVTFSGAMDRASIGVWTVKNYQSSTPVDAQAGAAADPATVSLATTVNGAAMAMSYSGSYSSSTDFVWGGMTEDFDAGIESSDTISGASKSATSTGTLVVTADYASVSNRMVGVSFR